MMNIKSRKKAAILRKEKYLRLAKQKQMETEKELERKRKKKQGDAAFIIMIISVILEIIINRNLNLKPHPAWVETSIIAILTIAIFFVLGSIYLIAVKLFRKDE